MDDVSGGVEGVKEDVGVEDEGLVEERPGRTNDFYSDKSTNKLDSSSNKNKY